jgi:anti-sigma B factor antagonist
MEVLVASHGPRVAVAHLKGRLDLISATDVRARLTGIVTAGEDRVVVDLAEVPFIDSSGLGALISVLKSARQAGGDLRIANPNDQPLTVLKLTTLDRVLKPYTTVEEALTGL